MLKKNQRLAKSADVKTVISRGKGFFSPYFNIKYFISSSGFKATVVVSTKVDKRAVHRNRIKRQLREILRLNVGGLRPGKYAIMAKPAAAKLANEHLRQEFLKLLVGSRLLNPIL